MVSYVSYSDLEPALVQTNTDLTVLGHRLNVFQNLVQTYEEKLIQQ